MRHQDRYSKDDDISGILKTAIFTPRAHDGHMYRYLLITRFCDCCLLCSTHLQQPQPRFAWWHEAGAQFGGSDVEFYEERAQEAGRAAHEHKHRQLPHVVVVALAVQR